MRARVTRLLYRLKINQRGNALVATTLALPLFIGAGAAALDGALWYLGNTALKEAAENAAYSAAAAKTEAEARSAAETVFLAGAEKFGALRTLDIAFSKAGGRDVADLRVTTALKLPITGLLLKKVAVLGVSVKSSNLDRTSFLQQSDDGGPPSLVVNNDGMNMEPMH